MNVEADHSSSVDLGQSFNDILSPMAFRTPDGLRASSWLEHVPFAYWLVERVRPSMLVELGTFSGTSYLAFCDAVQALGAQTKCSAVDTWQGDSQSDYYGEEIYRALADYHEPRYSAFSRLIRSTFDAAVDQFEDHSIDLLHIDGLHTYDAVRHDFETWRPKLSPRAVVLFHDTAVRDPQFGVWRLWDELTAQYPDHFQFLHCYGLGVLGFGGDLPAAARRFFARARTGEGTRLIRDVYSRLGAFCSATLLHEQLTDALTCSNNMAIQRRPRR